MNKSAVFGLALCALSASSASGALLYNISSFNNDGSTSTQQWQAGITTITTLAGITGTDDAGLLANQTLQNSGQAFQNGRSRFSNQSAEDALFQTVTTDVNALTTNSGNPGYFEFGIDATSQSFNVDNLTFQALRATTGTATRGFRVEVSVDGGAFSTLGASNIANNRSNGLESFALDTVGATYDDIDSIDFRVFSSGGAVQYTNFAVNGIVIPEPSSTLLGGLGALALMIRRRR